jgi:hypothetical protein
VFGQVPRRPRKRKRLDIGRVGINGRAPWGGRRRSYIQAAVTMETPTVCGRMGRTTWSRGSCRRYWRLGPLQRTEVSMGSTIEGKRRGLRVPAARRPKEAVREPLRGSQRTSKGRERPKLPGCVDDDAVAEERGEKKKGWAPDWDASQERCGSKSACAVVRLRQACGLPEERAHIIDGTSSTGGACCGRSGRVPSGGETGPLSRVFIGWRPYSTRAAARIIAGRARIFEPGVM